MVYEEGQYLEYCVTLFLQTLFSIVGYSYL